MAPGAPQQCCCNAESCPPQIEVTLSGFSGVCDRCYELAFSFKPISISNIDGVYTVDFSFAYSTPTVCGYLGTVSGASLKATIDKYSGDEPCDVFEERLEIYGFTIVATITRALPRLAGYCAIHVPVSGGNLWLYYQTMGTAMGVASPNAVACGDLSEAGVYLITDSGSVSIDLP